MARLPEGTLSGCVPPRGDMALGRIAAALEFTHRPPRLPVGEPNIAIARRVHEDPWTRSMELLCSHSVALGLQHIQSDLEPSLEFAGPSAKGLHENTGTQGELDQTKQFMEEGDYQPHELVLFTSPYNLGNAMRQARLIGLDPIVPPGQQGGFDWKSDQLWTKTWLLWALAAKPRLFLLRHRGH